MISDDDNVLIYAQLTLGDEVIADNIFYLSPYKALDFPDPELTYTISESNNTFEILIKTKKLAKDVYLSSGSDFNFSDNYFDMLPNSEKTVSIKKGASEDLAYFKKNLKVITLVDSYVN